MTSLLLRGEESPIKCGAVLSPITDFELYGKSCCCVYFFYFIFSVPFKCIKCQCLLNTIIQAQAELSECIEKKRERQIADLAPLLLSWEFFH